MGLSSPSVLSDTLALPEKTRTLFSPVETAPWGDVLEQIAPPDIVKVFWATT